MNTTHTTALSNENGTRDIVKLFKKKSGISRVGSKYQK